MNWFQKALLKESASVITLDYDHKRKGKIQNMHGNAGGAMAIRDLDPQNSYDSAGLMQVVPDNWDSMPRQAKSDFINKQTSQGKLRFPYSVAQWASNDFSRYPYSYLHAIAVCLQKTNKLPDFSREWIESEWSKETLPSDLKKLMDNALSVFPENRRLPFMLYQKHTETMLEPSPIPTAQPKSRPSVSPSSQKPKQKSPMTMPVQKPELFYNWKTDSFVPEDQLPHFNPQELL